MIAREFALRYAARGWPVLPIIDVARDLRTSAERRGKRPAPWIAPHGVDDATCDDATIRYWFADAALGVGIAAGASELVIVDVDAPGHGHAHDGRASLVTLEAQHGPLPPTPRVFTGSGGVHHYYRASRQPADVVTGELGEPVPLRAKLCPGVDLQSGHKYVVAPPTLHQCGGRYQWDPSALPSRTPVADLPAWIVDLARVVEVAAPPPQRVRREEPGTVIDRASKWLAFCGPSIQGSNGSGALMHAVTGLTRGFLLAEDDALVLLVTEFNLRCRPRWSDRELLHALKSARTSPKAPGYLLHVPRRCA